MGSAALQRLKFARNSLLKNLVIGNQYRKVDFSFSGAHLPLLLPGINSGSKLNLLGSFTLNYRALRRSL